MNKYMLESHTALVQGVVCLGVEVCGGGVVVCVGVRAALTRGAFSSSSHKSKDHGLMEFPALQKGKQRNK